ncbi:MAG TPA: cellulose biosynthesis cyclic di-GMP-binding regulatory protein BcsB [Gammaproteobacteria bacterium]
MVYETRSPLWLTKLQVLLLAYAVAAGAAHAAAMESGPVPDPTPPLALVTTLVELGYPSGFSFDDAALPDERVMLISLPQDSRIASATLHLVYRGSPDLDPRTTLSVAVNDRPLRVQVLTADDSVHELQLTIPEPLLRGGQLKVTVRGHVPTAHGRCVDGQPASGHIHIYPESSLITYLQGPPYSLRDAWRALPGEVTITLPAGPLDEPLFRAALDWVVLLNRSHRRVRLVTLPHLGHLVIAPEAEIRSALTQRGGEPARETLWSDEGANLGMVRFTGGHFIAATPPYADVGRFAARWQALFAPVYIDPTPLQHEEEHASRLVVDALGLSSTPAQIGNKVQWSATITPWSLPPGMRAQSAHIKVVLPRIEPKQPIRLYAYLNELLIVGERLLADGTEHTLEIPFDKVRHSEVYHLRVVARNGADDCTEPVQHYPIRIAPESHVSLQPESQPPSGFASLPTAFGAGFDLYLPKEYLAQAPERLPMLGRVLAGFAVPSASYRLRLFDAHEPPVPQRNFVVAAEVPPSGSDAALRFDLGRVALVNPQNETIVDESRLRQSSVIQMVQAGEASGLWLHPGANPELPVVDTAHLGDNDVALYEPDHLLLTIDSHQEDLVRAHYPDAPRWFERLHAQRFFWLMASWLLLTLGILYLFVKSRQHRNS